MGRGGGGYPPPPSSDSLPSPLDPSQGPSLFRLCAGESDAIPKDAQDPFLISGTSAVEGYGRVLVGAVGVHSFAGRLHMATRGEAPDTPLQTKLARYVKGPCGPPCPRDVMIGRHLHAHTTATPSPPPSPSPPQ